MSKDVLVLPEKAFLFGIKPWTPIISQMKLDDWEDMSIYISPLYFNYDYDYYHFSFIPCHIKKFIDKKILTINLNTMKYSWRKPYSKEYP